MAVETACPATGIGLDRIQVKLGVVGPGDLATRSHSVRSYELLTPLPPGSQQGASDVRSGQEPQPGWFGRWAVAGARLCRLAIGPTRTQEKKREVEHEGPTKLALRLAGSTSSTPSTPPSSIPPGLWLPVRAFQRHLRPLPPPSPPIISILQSSDIANCSCDSIYLLSLAAPKSLDRPASIPG
jgi:hypothetical protein